MTEAFTRAIIAPNGRRRVRGAQWHGGRPAALLAPYDAGAISSPSSHLSSGLVSPPRREGRIAHVVVAASTVAIVAIAAAVIAVALLAMYVLPRGGRRKRPPRT
jgi:hypothetical protein